MLYPAIVIPAFNRAHVLERLLNLLQTAEYPPSVQVPLVISIDPEDGAPNPLVREVAESFIWTHGHKDVKLHEHHLGLMENFYYCGSLTGVYGAVIFLEDDLFVSPAFYDYAVQSLDFFKDDARVAGISLYYYQRNGFTHDPFIPLADGSDHFFMQIPSAQGQAWHKDQWERFTAWRAAQPNVRPQTSDNLHDLWLQFNDDEYFPILTKYLVSTERFYVFPRVSYTTGFGDPGVHFGSSTSYFQVPIQRGQFRIRFHAFDEADAVYDSFMEISAQRLKRLAPALRGVDFDVDLNATRKPRNIKSEYVLTTRACRNPIQTFSLAMRPAESNVVHHVSGDGINLARRADILWDKWSDLYTRRRLYEYHKRGSTGWRQVLKHIFWNVLKWFQ